MASKRLRRAVDSSDRRSDAVTDAQWRAALGVDYEIVDAIPEGWKTYLQVIRICGMGEGGASRAAIGLRVANGALEARKIKVRGLKSSPLTIYRPKGS